jgi:hypothetical protein
MNYLIVYLFIIFILLFYLFIIIILLFVDDFFSFNMLIVYSLFSYIHCTLFSAQHDQSVVAETYKAALAFLVDNQLISWRKSKGQYEPTKLGISMFILLFLFLLILLLLFLL